jgi:hypothetical protein
LPAASAAAVAAALLLAGTPGPPVVLTLADPTIDESSGLAVSASHPYVVWTHNDGGSVAQVDAIDRHGATVARVTLAGIDPYDPEALAPGTDARGRPALFLGDLGDNDRRRPDVSVFRFAEPSRLADQTVPATWYRFTYPDRPHDAEALLVGPTGRILIATKALSGAGLYRAPRHLVTQDQGTNRLTRIAGVPSIVTDGAYLPDGRFVLRTYTAVYVYDRPGHEVARAELPPQPQGESVAADGDRLLIGSEGVHSHVLAVPVPTGHTLSPPPPTTSVPTHPPSATAAPRQPSSSGTPGWALAGLGALVVLAGAAALAAARRRTR